jgi:hypothetical protein
VINISADLDCRLLAAPENYDRGAKVIDIFSATQHIWLLILARE